jgi:hypothetical protein
MTDTITVQTQLNLYVVRPKKKHQTNAPHVLTTEAGLGAGDEIVFVADGYYYRNVINGEWDGTGTAQLFFSEHEAGKTYADTCLELVSHSGRSAMIGEDGLEDAFGNPILAKLWTEVLNKAEWRYAPCEARLLSEPEDEQLYEAWREKFKSARTGLKASCSNFVWTLE